MMNGAGSQANGNGKKNGGILSRGVNEKPHRSVVIDDEDIDAYSPEYEESEHDDHAGLLDEEEARLRFEKEFIILLKAEILNYSQCGK